MTCSALRPVKASGGELGLDFFAGQAERGVSLDAGNHVVRLALLLDNGSGGHGVLAQTLVQLLTVAALFHSLHHDVLAGHEGQLCHQTAAHHLGIHHDTVGDVEHDVQDSVGGKEALSHGDTLVGAVVQRALKHWVPVVKLGFSTSTIR